MSCGAKRGLWVRPVHRRDPRIGSAAPQRDLPARGAPFQQARGIAPKYNPSGLGQLRLVSGTSALDRSCALSWCFDRCAQVRHMNAELLEVTSGCTSTRTATVCVRFPRPTPAPIPRWRAPTRRRGSSPHATGAEGRADRLLKCGAYPPLDVGKELGFGALIPLATNGLRGLRCQGHGR